MESFVDRYAAQDPNRAVDKRDETYLYYPAQETSYSHPCDTCGGTCDVPVITAQAQEKLNADVVMAQAF